MPLVCSRLKTNSQCACGLLTLDKCHLFHLKIISFSNVPTSQVSFFDKHISIWSVGYLTWLHIRENNYLIASRVDGKRTSCTSCINTGLSLMFCSCWIDDLPLFSWLFSFVTNETVEIFLWNCPEFLLSLQFNHKARRQMCRRRVMWCSDGEHFDVQINIVSHMGKKG